MNAEDMMLSEISRSQKTKHDSQRQKAEWQQRWWGGGGAGVRSYGYSDSTGGCKRFRDRWVVMSANGANALDATELRTQW